MRYALIEAGALVEYPYDFHQLRRDNPDVSYPRDPDDNTLAQFGVVAVADAAKPVSDPITQNVIEGDPVEVAGVWTQTWIVVAASPGEVAERTQEATLKTGQTALKADGFVAQFIAMTPAQAQDFVNANGATVAALRTQVARLAFMVNVLVKRELQS